MPGARRRAEQPVSNAAFNLDIPSYPLTGFIGERTNRQVAVMTDDFRRYHALAPFFEQQGVQLLGLGPDDPIPMAVQVVLDGPEGDPRSVPLRDDLEATWLAVIAALDGRSPYRRIVIGIDPGETIGLAVLADGMPFWVAECHQVGDVANRIRAWRTGLDAQRWEVHVGDGAPEHGKPLVEGLRRAFPGVPIDLVPEQASSPRAPMTQSRHTDAAIHIAIREAEA